MSAYWRRPSEVTFPYSLVGYHSLETASSILWAMLDIVDHPWREACFLEQFRDQEMCSWANL